LLKVTKLGFYFGDLLIFSATLFWAAENIISKYVLRRLSPRIVALGRMFFGSIIILIYLAFTKQFNQIFAISFSNLLWILFTSLLLYLYVTSWYTSLKFTKVSTASSILMLGSVVTALLSFLFSGNSFGNMLGNILTMTAMTEIIGIILLIAGALIVSGFRIRMPHSTFSTAKPK